MPPPGCEPGSFGAKSRYLIHYTTAPPVLKVVWNLSCCLSGSNGNGSGEEISDQGAIYHRLKWRRNEMVSWRISASISSSKGHLKITSHQSGWYSPSPAQLLYFLTLWCNTKVNISLLFVCVFVCLIIYCKFQFSIKQLFWKYA